MAGGEGGGLEEGEVVGVVGDGDAGDQAVLAGVGLNAAALFFASALCLAVGRGGDVVATPDPANVDFGGCCR